MDLNSVNIRKKLNEASVKPFGAVPEEHFATSVYGGAKVCQSRSKDIGNSFDAVAT
jgi:hypothetical protein